MKRIIIILASIVISTNCFAQEQDTVTTGILTNATPTDMDFGDIIPRNDVFYTFIPNESTTISIVLSYAGGDKGIALSAYPNITTILASSDEEGYEPSPFSSPKTIVFDCIEGITYLIRVFDYEGIGGSFTISLKDEKSFNVTAIAGIGGTVVLENNTYIRNSECTVYAVSSACYRFLNWTEGSDVVSNEIEYTFLVDRNRNLKANFKENEYEIYSFAENGTITPTHNVNCGGNTTFKFYPIDNCYEFEGLWVDGEPAFAIGDTSHTFTNVREGYTIFASFKKKQHPITASNSLYGYIIPGTKNVPCGDTVTYCFVPQTLPNPESELHYILVDGDTIWANDSRIVNNCFTFNFVDTAHTIHAAFKRITFNISASADGHSTITPNGNIEVIKGNNCNFLIEVTNPCYEIDSVFINGVYNQNATNNVYYNGVYTFLNVIANSSIKIKTKQKEFQLYASSENGTITPTENVICGGGKTFKFYPADSCYQFAGLFVDGNAVVAVGDTAYTFTNVTENHTIFALFTKIQYAIAASSSDYGYITPSGTTDVSCGDTVTYCFIPQTLPNPESELHYIVVDGTIIYAGSDEIINNCYTFNNVTEPHTIFAAFKRITFTVLTIPDAHSTIIPSGIIEVIKGENCHLIIEVTDNCYEIDSVFINGIYNQTATLYVKYNGEYTFPNVTANQTIRISTKQKDYKLKVFCGDNGVVKLNGTGNAIAYGEEISYLCGAGSYLEFTPAATYIVSQVLLDNENITHLVTDNKLYLSSITGNHSLSVTFKKPPVTLYFFAYGNGKVVFDGCDNNCNMLEVEYNSTPKICFLPENNTYKIAYILIDGEPVMASHFTDNCYTLPPVTANHQIKAYFVPSKTYHIYVLPSVNGQIDPSDYPIPVEESESQQFCFYPENNYVVDFVMVDDSVVHKGDITCYTIENVMSDHSIYVSFSLKTGIEDMESSFIKIYPNPVDNLLTIESSELKAGDKIDIFDMSGKLVLSLTINETNKVSVNVGGLSQGTYIFKLGNIHGKFIKR